jgi:4-alpha-glucanotransferase
MISRGSGILMHLSSLPSPFGIGDMGPAAYRFADSLAAAGVRYWQILPLTPSNPENGESPYFSASAFAVNPLLVSPELMAEDGFIDRSDLAAPPAFPAEKTGYPAVRKYKTTLIDRAYRRFSGSTDRAAFTRFCAAEKEWLDDFCLFQSIKRGSVADSWTAWARALRDRDKTELARVRMQADRDIEREQFTQWLAFSQWLRLKKYCAGKKVAVIGDLPIYVSLESADVWANPQFFKLDAQKHPVAVSGVPPDYFSATGQLWNNPVYDWNALQGDGFGWWKRRLAATFKRFDLVRIDHFRGLVQYWEVPAGEPTAINGSWQDVPTRAFFDAMLAAFPGFPVIAEDLGIITPDVVDIMRHYGFPGMKVLQFAFGEDNPGHPYLPHTYDENCVAYTGTHDNLPFRAWIEEAAGPPERARLLRYLGLETAEAGVIWNCIEKLMLSKASLVVIPLQDLLWLGADARMNDPAKTFGNWQWRCTPEQLELIPWKRFKQTIKEGGR